MISYDGIAGDFLSAGTRWTEELSRLFRSPKSAEICRTLFKNWSWVRPGDDVLKWGLNEDFFKKIGEGCAIARITEELKKHASSNSPLFSFNFWTRCRRKIALMSYAVNTGVPKMYSPYLDHDLYDFLTSLPEALVGTGTLHTRAIARAFPQYAHIPYEQNTAKKISVSEHREKFTREFAWYMLKGGLGTSRVLRSRYLLPRMAKSLLNKKFCANLWRLMPPTLVYLSQLEKLQNVKGKPL